MTPEEIADLAHLRRARDLMDRDYAQPLDVPAMARTALMSLGSFSSRFTEIVGETPSEYRGRDHSDTAVIPPCVSRTDDLDTTFEKVRASGAEVLQEPVSQPFGPRDCAFRDPSVNLVRIAQA